MSIELDSKLAAVFQADGDHQTLSRLYDQWARDFDRDIWSSGNPYIAVLAGYVGRHLPNPDARILDAGCGTGLLGQILSQIGYRNLVGLDASQGMLDVAKVKGCYIELHKLLLGENIALPEASFDAITAAGVLVDGHAPPASLDGLLRLAKPGAPIIFNVSEVAALQGDFVHKMRSLTACCAWKFSE